MRLSSRDRREILRLLRPNIDTEVKTLLWKLESACESYRDGADYYRKARRSRALLTRLSVLAARLIKTIEEIDNPCAIYLERNSWSMRPEGEELKIRLADLDRACRRRGRPVAKAEEFFIEDLVRVWREARGQIPRRSYNYRLAEESGEFHRLVKLCLRVSGVGIAVPTGVVRRVLDTMRDKERHLEREFQKTPNISNGQKSPMR
jgi:hypothetical protein